jgi:hypothetical protein
MSEFHSHGQRFDALKFLGMNKATHFTYTFEDAKDVDWKGYKVGKDDTHSMPVHLAVAGHLISLGTGPAEPVSLWPANSTKRDGSDQIVSNEAIHT